MTSVQVYGGEDEWNQATVFKVAKAEEKRIDPNDGQPYNQASFIEVRITGHHVHDCFVYGYLHVFVLLLYIPDIMFGFGNYVHDCFVYACPNVFVLLLHLPPPLH